MPKLPDYTALGGPGVPTPPRGVASYSPTSGMESVPAQELGQSSNVMETASKIAMAMQDQHDSLRAEDAFNQLRQKQIDLTFGPNGYANLKGANAVNQPVLKSYGSEFDQAASNLSNNLDNDYQRKLFERRAQVAGLELRQGMVRHISTQSDAYATEVFKSTLNTEINSATADPTTTSVSLARIDNNIKSYADRFGLPKEWTDQNMQGARADIYASQIRTAMVNDPLTARRYFQLHADELGKHRPQLEYAIKQATLPVDVKNEAEQIMGPGSIDRIKSEVSGGAPFPAAGPQSAANTGMLFAALVKAESGGAHTTDSGELLTSSVGAKGITQVMPKTGTNPGYGVKPLQNQSKEEYLRFGQDYLNAMLTEFSGDPQKAVAAYNWGPDNVKSAVAQYGDQWIQHVPRETQNEIAKVTGSTPSSPTTPADTKANLGAWIAEAERRYPNDPVKRDALISQIKANVSTIVTMQQGVQQQAHQTLNRLMMPQQGPEPTTVTQLTSTPEGQQAWVLQSTESQRGFIAWLDQNQRKAEGKPSKINATIMLDLGARIHLPASDPLAITNANQLIPYMSQGLTVEGKRSLEKEIDERLTPDGRRLGDVRKAALGALLPRFDSSTMLFHDERGKEDFLRFKEFVTQQEAAMSKAGKDPYLLYVPPTPGHPNSDYIGKYVPGFVRSVQQKVQDRADSMSGKTPGETPGGAVTAKPKYPTAVNPKTGETLIFKDGRWQTR